MKNSHPNKPRILIFFSNESQRIGFESIPVERQIDGGTVDENEKSTYVE